MNSALNEVIRGHVVLPYSSLPNFYLVLEVDPDNSNNLIMLYSGQSMPASALGTQGPTVWNREHLWPQSWGTSSGPGNSDVHHVFPTNGQVNTERSNYYFDWTDPAGLRRVISNGVDLAPGSTYDSNSFEPRNEDKGRVARAMLYMATRYDGRDSGTPNLQLGNRPNSSTNTFAYLDPILTWNRMFSPDPKERRRNHLIHNGAQVGTQIYRQRNRNPFIDFPELADAIYLSSSTITYGSWRWLRFSIDQLHDVEMSGDLADPDGDGIANLIELSADLDPLSADDLQPLTVIRLEDQQTLLQWQRLVHRELSGLSYHIEVSASPFNEDSWQEMILDGLSIVSTVAGVQTVETQVPSVSDTHQTLHFRLRVERTFPIDNTGSANYDPVAAKNSSGSVFAYDPSYGLDWKWSWAGWVWNSSYPWININGSTWMYIVANTPDGVWLFTENSQWLWTSQTIFPQAFDLSTGTWGELDSFSEPVRL